MPAPAAIIKAVVQRSSNAFTEAPESPTVGSTHGRTRLQEHPCHLFIPEPNGHDQRRRSYRPIKLGARVQERAHDIDMARSDGQRDRCRFGYFHPPIDVGTRTDEHLHSVKVTFEGRQAERGHFLFTNRFGSLPASRRALTTAACPAC